MKLYKLFKEQKEFFYADTTIPINFRMIHLSNFKRSLLKHEGEFYEAIYKDLGKSKEDFFVSEFSSCIKEIDYFLKHLPSLSKPKKVKTSIVNFKSKGYIYNKPYGVCLVVGTWNYPIRLSILPLIGAIASGNTCILKLHPLNKNINELLNKIISQVFEKYYVKCLDGEMDVLDNLLTFDFDYIFATGSPNMGKYIYSKASEKLIPITLELGGKNPCIVHSDANLEIASKRICHGKFLNAGQTCLAPDYILVHKNKKEELINSLTKTIKNFYPDSLFSNHYAKISSKHHFDRLTKFITDLKDRIIIGGDFDKNSLRISPTLIDCDGISSPLLEEEIFGPILPITSYEVIDDVIYALKYKYPSLSLYLFSENKAIINKVLNIPFGGGCINDTLLHVSEHNLPFGGFKNSGIGNYHGKYSFDTFTHKKSVLIKSTKLDIESRYPNNKNYTLRKLKNLFGVKP